LIGLTVLESDELALTEDCVAGLSRTLDKGSERK
jgi:hypothetical protein